MSRTPADDDEHADGGGDGGGTGGPAAPNPDAPARRFGAPREANVLRMEHVRVTAPDLARRAAMERTRGRLVLAAAGFAVLFGAVAIKLADATVLDPMRPRVARPARPAHPLPALRAPGGAEHAAPATASAAPLRPEAVASAAVMPDAGGPDTGGRDTGGRDTGGPDTSGRDTGGRDAGGPEAGAPEAAAIDGAAAAAMAAAAADAAAAAAGPVIPAALDTAMPGGRAMITDRNNNVLAISLPTAGLYANPKEMVDTADVAHRLKLVLPQIDEAQVHARLADERKQFVYLARQITPKQQLQINDLGVPGIYFQRTERRHYPLGRVAAQVLGGVDIDEHGVGGVEKFFDARLHDDPAPLRLSLDVRVQAVVREELLAAMQEFQAIGACGIVMDVRTGEVIAMVSLPDYEAEDFGRASPDQKANRAVGRVYEPGSTFKLQTASMALDDGVVHIWNGFDASAPIKIGHHTINDFEGKHRWLYVPEIIAYSSNIGAAHMAQAVGAERQRDWMQRMGMLARVPIELPEVAAPLAPKDRNWGEAATLTIGFGHGIAVTPLHVVAGTAAVANGGVLMRPTILLAQDDAAPRSGVRVMQTATSDIMRKLMRLVVTDGFGKAAEVAGYYVGGKTGTAEKTAHHGYNHNARVSAFMGVFPMNAPRYAVYMMLDEPHADASTHGYATAGWVSAPATGKVIARAAPMLGLLPDIENAAAIKEALAIPLQPTRPGGAPPRPAAPAVPMARAAPGSVPGIAPTRSVPIAPPLRDLRHEAFYVVPTDDAE